MAYWALGVSCQICINQSILCGQYQADRLYFPMIFLVPILDWMEKALIWICFFVQPAEK